MSIGSVHQEHALVQLELYQTGMIVFVFIVLLILFPDDPTQSSKMNRQPLLSVLSDSEPVADSDSDSAQGASSEQLNDLIPLCAMQPDLTVLQGLKACASNPSCMLLIVACSVVNGAYVSWQSLMPILFSNMPSYDSHDGDLFGFSSGICYCAGGYLSGTLGDGYFRGRLRTMLVLVYGAALANFAVLMFVMESPLSPLLPSTGRSSYVVVAAAISMTGLFVGATMPPSLELLAEVSFPVSEGTTANMVQALNMISLVLTTAVLPLLPPDYCNSFMAGTVLFCALSNGLVQNSNARQQAAGGRETANAGTGTEAEEEQEEARQQCDNAINI
jgi:hypothetical protein